MSYSRIGDVLEAQGKLDEALETYHDGLAIAERLAAADRSNTQWQHDLSVSFHLVGDVQVAQGKLDVALRAYREGFAIRERLAVVDRVNVDWQRDLSVSFDVVGDMLMTWAGRLEEARPAYRDSLAIRERLVAADRGNADWQRDLSVSYDMVGDVLVAQAIRRCPKCLPRGLAIPERLAAPIPATPRGSAISLFRTTRLAICWRGKETWVPHSIATVTDLRARSAPPTLVLTINKDGATPP